MYAYEKFAARPTMDIDFLANNIGNEGESIISAFREICSIPYEEDGVTFDIDHIAAQNITEFKDYHGIRLSISVKMDTIAQVMTINIGFGDVVTPEPIDLDYPVLLEQMPRANVRAYSIETVIAEKMHAVVDLAGQSSRMKDYSDLYNLLSKEKYDRTVLQEAIIRTFKNRHTPYDANTIFFSKDFSGNQQMQVRWQAFLRKITRTQNVKFQEIVTFIQNKLLPYWEQLSYV